MSVGVVGFGVVCVSVKQSTTVWKVIEPVHEIMILITLATSEGPCEPALPCSLARAFAVRTHEVWKYQISDI